MEPSSKSENLLTSLCHLLLSTQKIRPSSITIEPPPSSFLNESFYLTIDFRTISTSPSSLQIRSSSLQTLSAPLQSSYFSLLKNQYERKYKTTISSPSFTAFYLLFPTFDLYTFLPSSSSPPLKIIYAYIIYSRSPNILNQMIGQDMKQEMENGFQFLYYFEDSVRYKDDEYCGEFNIVKLFPHGKGMFTYCNKSKYCGEFYRGKRHGYGKYVYCNGNVYIGEWKEDARKGEGCLRNISSEMTYYGKWKNGLHCGLGLYYKDEMNFYYGMFNRHYFEGKGFRMALNKDGHAKLDIGEWKEWMLNGKAKNYNCESGEVEYEGDYKNDLAEGAGTFYKNGRKNYQGMFKQGKPHGYGIIFDDKGDGKMVVSKQGKGMVKENDCLVY